MRRGITRVEAMIVGGLVAALAALLMLIARLPELHERQRAGHCLTNLRQMTAATRMYLDDNDGRFPFAGRDHPHAPMVDVWTGLRPYVESPEVFLCPSDPSPAHTVRWVRRHGGNRIREKEVTLPSSYTYPVPFYHSMDCSGGKNVLVGPPRSMPVSAVQYPAQKALFVCYASEWQDANNQRPYHQGGHLMGFVDGHAAVIPPARVHRGVRGKGLDEGYNFDWTRCGIRGKDID